MYTFPFLLNYLHEYIWMAHSYFHRWFEVFIRLYIKDPFSKMKLTAAQYGEDFHIIFLYAATDVSIPHISSF